MTNGGLLFASGVLLIALAVTHSVLGEMLLLHRVKAMDGFPSILGGAEFPRRTIRSVWHIPSIFGGAFALMLFRYARSEPGTLSDRDVVTIKTIAAALLLSAIVTFIGTKARHAGWVAFAVTAALAYAAVS